MKLSDETLKTSLSLIEKEISSILPSSNSKSTINDLAPLFSARDEISAALVEKPAKKSAKPRRSNSRSAAAEAAD